MSQNLRARVAISFLFTFTGSSLTAWAVHIPQVKAQFALNNSQVSLIIIMLGLGALASMNLMGHLVDKKGSKFATTLTSVLAGAALILPGLAPNVLTLCIALFITGIFMGGADVSMNAHAVEVEKAYGRPIFSAFHAFWSLGGVIGAAIGGAALAAGLPMAVTLSSLGVFCGVIALLLNAWLLDNPKIAANKEKNAAISKEEQKAVKKEQSKANRPFMKLVIALGIMAGSGALIEGIGIDWSALFAVDVLNATVSQAALFVMFFSGAMASFRLVADKVVAKVGRLNVIRYGSAISALGVAFALAQTSIPVSIAGWFIAGLGISAVVPQIFAYSAEVGEESHSGRNMAIVFGLCYAGMLGGPAVIGWVANLAPLGTALLFGSLLGAFIFVASWFLPKPKPLNS